MQNSSKTKNDYFEIFIILAATLCSIFFWDSIVLYPIKLFVVLIHEICHGIAAVLTGGKILGIKLSLELGGQCETAGGMSFIIASSGYLGSLILGSLLFLSSYRQMLNLWFSSVLGTLLIVFSANYMRGATGIVFSIVFALILFFSPRIFNGKINSYLMRIIGLISTFYVIVDIKEDLLTRAFKTSDAEAIADTTGIPAIYWGLLWFAISAIVVMLLLKYSLARNLGPKKRIRKKASR